MGTLEFEVIEDLAEERSVLIDRDDVRRCVRPTMVRQIDGDEIESLGQPVSHVPVCQHAHRLWRRHQHLWCAGRPRSSETKAVATHGGVFELHRRVVWHRHVVEHRSVTNRLCACGP
jgi:hypothetical protein